MIRTIPCALLAAAAVAVGTAAAPAAGPSYNHLGVGLADIDLGDGDIDGSGVRVDGSFLVHESIYLLGYYADWDLEGVPGRAELRAGAGLRAPLQADTDVIGELSYENRQIRRREGRDRERDGLGLRGGLRAATTSWLELEGGTVLYLFDLDDDDEVGLYGRAWYEIVAPFLVSGEVEVTDEQNIIGLGGRLRF